MATITGQAGGGGGASLSDDEPEAVSETAAAGTGTEASRSDHRHAGIAWGVQIDTQIVPEANEDAISTQRISLRTSGLNHYLAFLDWDTADLARVDHLPVGGHIGLRQGVNTRILRVEAAWEASENRYQVANVNAAPLTEASAGTDTELLLTTSSEADGVVSASDYSITDGVLTLTRTVGAALTVNVDEIVRPVGGVLPTAADHEDRIGLSGNALFQSRYVVTVPSHSRSVTVATLPVGGVTVGGTTYGDDYAGNFAAPPNVNNYAANEYIWDRGSQVWLFNGPNPMGGRHWIGYSGPPGFRHGTFTTDADAEAHANGVGEIFIVGSGSSQLVRYVSAFTAATAEQSGWVWQHLGTTVADVETTITGRLSGTAPPAIGITGNAGSSTEIARGDHHHLGQTSVTVANAITARLSDDDPAAVATAASEGTGTDASRDDHRHAGVASLAASEGLQVSQTVGAVSITADLSSAAPEAVGATESAGGTDETISRSRHVHAGVTSISAGTGISVDQAQGAVTVTATGGGGSADGVADSLDLAIAGSSLTVTIGRSGTLADLVDDVILPSGGVSTVAFHAGISADTAVTSSQTTWTQVLQLSTADINEGSFTIESQTDDTERVCVPDDGLYVVRAQIGAAADASTTQRFTLESRFTITPDGGTETAQDEIARQYNRGRDTDAASGATNLSGGHLASMYDLDADDCIGVQTRTQLSAINYTVQSAVSYVEIVKQQLGAQGPEGPAGAAGAAGADGSDVDFEDEGSARVGVTTVDFTGAGVTATVSGGVLDVAIPGGSGSETLFGRGEPPEATAALVGMRYLDLTSKVLYGAFDDPHRTSESTGDFDDISRTDIEINLNDRLEDITVVEDEWLYRVASNRFYAGTDVGSNQLAWVDDTADNALAASLVTNTDEVVWLGRHLDNEEALMGLTAIETGKEYFFYREQDGTIVRLDNSTFAAAGSTVAHPFWLPIKADDREEHIFDARDGLPTLANDGSDDNRIGVTNDGVYIVDVDPIAATDPTADSWADYTATDYEGAFAADPTIDTGHWYANYIRRTFREFQSTNFGLGWIPHDAPTSFIGWYDSRQDALDHAAERGVASGGDFVAFTGVDSDPAVETATNFTPATLSRIQRNWVFITVGAGGSASLSDATPDALTPDQAGAAGTGTAASRSDHAHQMTAGTAQTIGTSNAEGSGSTVARSDHRHQGVASIVTSGSGLTHSASTGTVTLTHTAHTQRTLATATPEDVQDTGAVGTGTEVARTDHVHQLPIDNTMQFDGSDDLGVNVQRVVQEVSEWVQHFASGDSHDTSGHSGKYHEYTSSDTHRRIGSVQYDFDPENDDGTRTFQVFILELTGRNIDVILGSSPVYSGNSQQHRFHFADGVMINPNVRIGIGLHRTDGGNNEGLRVRSGTESQDSPRESYDDASNDFNFLGRFNHDRPTPTVSDTVGGTASGQIYGNPEIFYQIIHTHASLVGDGTVSSSHISSGSAAADAALLADGSGGTGFRSVVVHGDNIVDNTIPTAKYGNETVTAGKMSSGSATNGHVATADGSGGVDYEAVEIGGVTHVESGATYNNNVITVATTGTVRGGDGILFAVPTPFGTSATQEISLAIDGQANSEHPLHDRNGDVLHEADLTGDSVYIAISDADSWDILFLPDETSAGGGASLSDATPDSLQPDQTGSAGTATDASRADHAHAIASSTPVGLGTSNQEGSFTSFARTNHVHRAFDSTVPSAHGIGQSGAAGTSTMAARRDHVHAIPVGVPVAVGTANAEGTATTASRSDHVHEGDGAGGDAFDLHDDVTTAISTLDDNDRFVVSDENLSGDPNRYVTLAAVATKLAGTGLTASAGVLSASGGGGGGDGDGVVAITPRTESAHNFSFNGTIQSGQERDLFDTNITLPDGLASDETFVIRINATHGYAEIVLSQALLEELDTESPVTWSTSATGVAAVNSGDSQNVYFIALGQNRGAYVGRSNETPQRLLWAYTHSGAVVLQMQLMTLTAGSGSTAGGRGKRQHGRGGLELRRNDH